MSVHPLHLGVLFCVLSLLVNLPPVSAQTQRDNGPRMIVLTNGQIIEGLIEQRREKTHVISPAGSRLVFDNQRVDFSCNTYEEAYWQKNARTRANDVQAHRALFYWCLRYDLLNKAQNQIDILQMMDIRASDLYTLNRQLQVAFDRKNGVFRDRAIVEHRRQRIQRETQAVPEVEQHQGIVFTPLPGFGNESVLSPLPEQSLSSESDSADSVIRQVNFEDKQMNPLVPLKPLASKPATIAELEKTASRLSPQAIAMFKRKVEPALVRGCFLCHNKPENPMPLMRLGKNQMIPKRMSQRNLHSMMKFVDYDQPLHSPLFKAAVGPHANLDDPVIRDGSEAFQNLGQWLIMISRYPNQPHAIPDFSKQTEQPLIEANQIPSNVLGENESTLSQTSMASDKKDVSVPSIPDLKVGRNSNEPRDPFDVEEFNRQHSNQDSKKEASLGSLKND